VDAHDLGVVVVDNACQCVFRGAHHHRTFVDPAAFIFNIRLEKDRCTRIGHATSGDGQTFVVTFDNAIQTYTDGLRITLIFDNDQTVAAPTINADAVGAANMKAGASGAIAAYRILTGDILDLVYDADDAVFSVQNLAPLETCTVAPGTQVDAVTTGTKFTYPGFPGCKVIAVVMSVVTASSSGTITFNIKEGGTTIFSTTPTIDQGETSSITAATPCVISDHSIANNATVTFTIDGAGTNAAGPIWSMLIRRTTLT